MLDIRITPGDVNATIARAINFTEGIEGVTLEAPSVAEWKTFHLGDKNQWWDQLVATLTRNNWNYTMDIFPAATDGYYLEQILDKNISVIRISPLMNTPIMAHAPDESITAHSFLEGIQVYQQIITDFVQ